MTNIITRLKDGLKSLWKEEVIGLDIGEKTVKLAQVEIDGEIIQLNKLAIIETPSGVLEGGRLIQPEKLSKKLSAVLSENDFSGTKVVGAVSGENVITRTIEVPSMPRDELGDTVKWEADDQLRLSVEEASIDYEILNQNPDGSYKLLLIAVKRELIEKYLTLFEKLNLSPGGIETEPIALGRLIRNLHINRTICIIDVGFQTTDISVLNNGQLLFTRTINMGGKDITEDIAENREISFFRAETYKKKNNLFLGEQPNLIIRNLTTSIYRSLNYFQVENKKQELEKIFLTGGSSKLKGFPSYLEDEIGVRVEKLDLTRHFQSNLTNINFSRLEEVFPQMLVSIGLALRGEEDD